MAEQNGEKKSHFNDWPNTQGYSNTHEERTPTELEVVGTIPTYCAGVLFRNAPGPREIQTDEGSIYKINHWFDYLTQVHRFQIHAAYDKNSKIRVTHNSRLTCDGLIKRIQKTGSRNEVTFGAHYDPCASIFSKVQSVFNSFQLGKPDEVTVGVTLSPNFPGLSKEGAKSEKGYPKGKLHTLCNKTDNTTIQMLDPETLEPIGVTNQHVLHSSLKGPLSGAHAQFDPVTGDVYNYNLDMGPTGTYRVFTVSASTGKTSILAKFSQRAAYLHSMFQTEHYVILCVWNSFFKAAGSSILWNKNIEESISDYDKSKPSTWYVVDKKPITQGGKGLVATYVSDPFFSFHTINAYEEPSPTDPTGVDIVADASVYDNNTVLKRLYIDNIMSDSPSALPFCDPSNTTIRAAVRRFRLPHLPSKPNRTPLKAVTDFSSEKGISPELPTMNGLFRTKRHRYVYGVTDTGKSVFLDGLIKYDVETRSGLQWTEHGQTAGEPIFVANPEGKEEDDGMLLTVVLDGLKGESYLLVLDAKDMKEVGRANVGGVIGFGFHGMHMSDNGDAVNA